MKMLALAVVASLGLAGCVAVPVAEPAPYYYSPPAVVVQPSIGFYGYYGYHGHHRNWGPRRRW